MSPDPIGSTYIKYKGPYDFDGLYKLVHKWIKERRYHLEEKRYKDKIDNPTGTEVEIEVQGKKKVTPYIRYWIDVGIHAYDYMEKEGMLHGKKQYYTDGRVTIQIVTSIEFDWQNRFNSGKAAKIMKQFYHWIMKKEHELVYIDDVEYEALRLEQEVKKFLKMETDTNAY